MRVPLIGLLGLALAGFASTSHADLFSDLVNEAARQAGVSSSQRDLANKVIKAVTAPPPASAPVRTPPSTFGGRHPPVQPTEEQGEIADFAGNAIGVPLRRERGALTPMLFKVWDNALPKGQANVMRDRIDAILAPIRQTPALSTLQGFSIDQSVQVMAMQASPAAGAKALLLVRRVDPARSTKDASGALKGIGEGPGITVRINDQRGILGEETGKGGYSFVETRPRFLQGFPVYTRGRNDVVVIARPGRTPFTPMSKQFYWEREIADDLEAEGKWRSLLAKEQDPASREELENTLARLEREVAEKRAQLAALPGAERRSPVCPNHERRGGPFGDCNGPYAQFEATFNPDYFDASKPKNSIQLITIEVVSKRFLDDKDLGTLARQAVSQLDFKALQAILE